MSAQLQPAWHLAPLTAEDLDAVMALEAASYSHPWTRGNFKDALASGYRAEGLWCDGTLIGYCIAQAGVDEMHLLNLTVAPRWRRQGHARALLHRLIAAARDAGHLQLLLEVRPSNASALALYRREGFETIGRRRGYYPAAVGREDAEVMRRTIDLTEGLA